MGETKGPPLLELEWMTHDRNYQHAEEIFAEQKPEITIRCKGGQTKVRHATLFNLMKYFKEKENDTEFFDRRSHNLDSVDVEILQLVVRFVEKGNVKLRQNEYARFGQAVRLLRPKATYEYTDKYDDYSHCIAINLLGYTEHFSEMKIKTGDIKIMCEKKPMFFHYIIATMYSGVLKRKIEAAERSDTWDISVDDITYKELDSIRRLIHGFPTDKNIDLLPDFLNLLERYEISYTHISPFAVQLPPLTDEQMNAIAYGEEISIDTLEKRERKRRLKMGKKNQSSKQRWKVKSARKSSKTSAKKDDDNKGPDPQPSTSGVQGRPKVTSTQKWKVISAGKSSDISSKKDDDKKEHDPQPSTSGVQRRREVTSTHRWEVLPAEKSSDTSSKKGPDRQPSTSGVKRRPDPQPSTSGVQWRPDATIDSPPPTKKKFLKPRREGRPQEGAIRTHETPEKIRKSASFPEQQESTSSTSGVQEVELCDIEPFNTAPGPSSRSRERLPETEVSRIGESQPESDDYDSDTDSVFTDESVSSSE